MPLFYGKYYASRRFFFTRLRALSGKYISEKYLNEKISSIQRGSIINFIATTPELVLILVLQLVLNAIRRNILQKKYSGVLTTRSQKLIGILSDNAATVANAKNSYTSHTLHLFIGDIMKLQYFASPKVSCKEIM